MFLIGLIQISLLEEEHRDIENEEALINPLTDEEINEDLIIKGLKKIVRIFKIAKDGKVIRNI